jgi:hypothetical protein
MINDDEIDWEALLEKEGMPSKLKKEKLGKKIRLGLGVKTEKDEQLEEDGGHSFLCPLVIGKRIDDGKLDQPGDRSVEED